MANGSNPAPAGEPVDETAAHLRLLERTAAAANESATLAAAAGAALRAVCAHLGWPVGHLYALSPGDDKVLVSTSTWYLADPARFAPLLAADGAPGMPSGDGLAGRVLDAREPVWAVLADPAASASNNDGHSATGELAGGLGLHAAFGFPVLVGDEVVAVLEFFSDTADPPTVEIRSLLAGVTHQVAGVVERTRAAEAVEEWKGRYQALERHLAAQALHDPLTSLPNRTLLLDRLQQALVRAERQGSSVAVLSLDLDNFKVVNDTLGHDAGDQVLLTVAERLQSTLHPGDTVARMGGDEFAVLCEDVSGADEAAEMAKRLTGAFEGTFTLPSGNVEMKASMGVAVATGGEKAYDRLVQDAHVAMHRAKSRREGGFELFDETMRVHAADRLVLEHELRQAVGSEQFRLLYQPIVAVSTGDVVGVEALVRWEHPTRGLLPPSQFIAMAEETGVIVSLGRWVLEQACSQAQLWSGAGAGRVPRMSVNVSARQFQEPGWLDEVASVLATSRLDPRRLVLEITESVLMEHTEFTAERLGQLRALGVRVAIDDFGTGYSSLGYLRRFPVDILKIDKSFIDGVTEGPHESALARAVVKLAATLDLEAVAEGVSTRKQFLTLRRLRCGLAQGFYFSEPKPAGDITEMLAAGPTIEQSIDDATTAADR